MQRKRVGCTATARNLIVAQCSASRDREERFLALNPRAVRVRGPIKHIDRAHRISRRAFERVVVEWALIAKCSEIWPMSGYISTGLFLAPNATIFHEASVKAMMMQQRRHHEKR